MRLTRLISPIDQTARGTERFSANSSRIIQITMKKVKPPQNENKAKTMENFFSV